MYNSELTESLLCSGSFHRGYFFGDLRLNAQPLVRGFRICVGIIDVVMDIPDRPYVRGQLERVRLGNSKIARTYGFK